MFSRACEYGIRAVICIARQSLKQQRTTLKDIAVEIDSPLAFTAKILQELAKNGIVNSVTGPTGGFGIERKQMQNITLASIVSAIDGDSIYRACGLGLHECNAEKPCPVHQKFVKVRNELRAMLETTSIHELCVGGATGLTFLKR